MTEVEKEIRKQQRENLKKMSLQKKAEYLWTYYKWHLIGLVLLLIFTGLLLRDISYGSKPSYINVIMMNTQPGFDPVEQLVPDLYDLSGVDPEEYRINIDTTMYISDSPAAAQITMGSEQKLLALYAAKEADVMIAPESVVEHYLQAGIFADPAAILGPEMTEELQRKGFPLYFRKQGEMVPEEEGPASEGKQIIPEDKDVCLGIVINDSSYIKNLGVYDLPGDSGAESIIFTFSAVSENVKSSLNFLELLLNE